MDYPASPRMSVTTNWTRSVFEEVVRRRNELRADLRTVLADLVVVKQNISRYSLCMYVFMYVCMYVCMHVCMYVCIYVYMYVWIFAQC